MNYLFEKDLVSYLEEQGYDVDKLTQAGVRDLFRDNEELSNLFPMICFEYTDDNVFESTVYESKFINDRMHEGDWFAIGNDDEVLCVVNFQQHGSVLEIDTFEVNKDHRGEGIAREVLEAVETSAYNYYKCIEVSPFDTSAMNFWGRMGYDEYSGRWRKYLDEDEED